jgi:diacylglycerol kinase (ATP)
VRRCAPEGTGGRTDVGMTGTGASERPGAVLIIHNPVSGRKGAHGMVNGLVASLRRLDREVRVVATRHAGDATALAAQAVRDRCPMVVAAGGDGTVNEVIQALVGTNVVLGVLPVGTVNLWAAETGIPSDPATIAAFLDGRHNRKVDVGQAGSRYFLLMAGLGFDAAVVATVSSPLKQRLGRASYGVAAAKLAPFYRGSRICLRLDGREERMTALQVLIGNTRRYAGSWQPSPAAVADDGLLDVVVITGDRFWAGVPQLGALFPGGARLRQSIFRVKAAEIVIESNPRLPMQLDGDAAAHAADRIVSVRRALNVVVAGNPHGLFGASDG